ncbi:Beta-galactosidase C-terminal domain, partial [Nonomuraea angiospora]
AVEGLPPGVQASVRAGAGRRFLILLNHTGEKHAVTPGGEWTDALSGEDVESVTLPPSGVAVLRSAAGQ